MNARTPMSTLSPPLTTAVTMPAIGRLVGERLLQRRPVLRPLHLDPRKLVVAFRIAALDRDRHLVAGLHRVAGGLELRQRNDAFGLVADIEEHRFAGDRDHGALQALAALFALWEWDCSYCERISPNDSLGSLLVWDSGPVARS